MIKTKRLDSSDLARLLVDPTPQLQQAFDDELVLANHYFTRSADITPLWKSELHCWDLQMEVADFANVDAKAKVNIDNFVKITNQRLYLLGLDVVWGSNFDHVYDDKNWDNALETLAKSTSTSIELWKAADCTNGQNPFGYSIEHRYFQYILDRVFSPVYGHIKDGAIPTERLSNWLRNVATIVEYRVAEVKGKLEGLYFELHGEHYIHES